MTCGQVVTHTWNLCSAFNHPSAHTHMRTRTHTHTHVHTRKHACAHARTHTRWFLWLTGNLHRRNGFYTVQTIFSIALQKPYTFCVSRLQLLMPQLNELFVDYSIVCIVYSKITITYTVKFLIFLFKHLFC